MKSIVALRWLAALSLVASLATPLLGAEPSELLLRVRSGEQVSLHGLTLVRNGQNLGVARREALEHLRRFVDADGSETVSAAEAERLPTPFMVRQMLWGRFLSAPSKARTKGASQSSSPEPTRDEVQQTFLRTDADRPVLSWAPVPVSEELTQQLRKLVVADPTDLTQQRWNQCWQTAGELDINGDELLTPGELLPGCTYPGVAATRLVTPDSSAAVALADRSDSRIVPQKLTSKWIIDLTKQELTSPTEGQQKWGLVVQPDYTLRVQVGESDIAKRWQAQRDRLATQWTQFDLDGNGVLEAAELTASAAATDLGWLLGWADRDGDGRLTEHEVQAWQRVQTKLLASQAVLAVLDHGQGLFEFLDASGDGALSQQEIQSSWSRLSRAQVIAGGSFFSDRLPRQFRLVISDGMPQSYLAPPRRSSASRWFVAMDRNRDGVVSAAEYLGDLAAFARLDDNADGLLTPAEAQEGATAASRSKPEWAPAE